MVDKKLPSPPFQQEGGGREGCSKEPELNPDLNIEARDRELQVAGRLKYFLSAAVWMDITSDRKILDMHMVQHCHLEFTANPYQQYPKPPIKFHSEEAAIIDGEIQQLLGKGVLVEIDPTYGQYVSTIFLRLILNLKGLNASIEYQHFKMESLTCAIQLMKKNCYMASIDLTDAYYTVPVAVEHRKY